MLHHDQRNYAVAVADAKADFEQRLAQRIAVGQRQSEPILKRIEETGHAIEDLIVPLGNNGRHSGRFRYHEDGNNVALEFVNGSTRTLRLHPHAVRQVSEKLGLPGPWMRKLVQGETWQRQLAAEVLDQHATHAQRDRVLVRTIGDQARGILSTSYRRLDSALILKEFIAAAHHHGAAVYGASADDTRFWVEAALPHVFEVETPNNGVEYLSVGVVYSTSDFGDGADQVRAWIERAWCTNKAISRSDLRQVHLGRRLPDQIEFSRETYLHDTLTHASAVKDVVGHVLAVESVQQRLQSVARASDQPVELEHEVVVLQKAGITKPELERLQKTLMEADPQTLPIGQLTRWKLSQAVSHIAQDTAPRRRYELEELAGGMVFSRN